MARGCTDTVSSLSCPVFCRQSWSLVAASTHIIEQQDTNAMGEEPRVDYIPTVASFGRRLRALSSAPQAHRESQATARPRLERPQTRQLSERKGVKRLRPSTNGAHNSGRTHNTQRLTRPTRPKASPCYMHWEEYPSIMHVCVHVLHRACVCSQHYGTQALHAATAV